MSWEADPVDMLLDEFARGLAAESSHESVLRCRMLYESKSREMRIAFYGYDELVRSYYLGEGKHPDDERLPINLWDSVE